MTQAQGTEARLRLYRLNVRQFERMIDANVFRDEKVELIGGYLIPMTTNPPHVYVTMQLRDWFTQRLSRDEWLVREENPLKLSRSWRPNPDVAVVRGPIAEYARRTPGSSDVALLIEVSDSTYRTDTGVKLRRYEASGVAEYWVVDLNRRRVEVRRHTGEGFGPAAVYEESAELPVALEGREFGRLAVREILPGVA